MADDVVRLIDIQGKATNVDQTTASVEKLAGAMDDVVVNSDKTSRATLSVERAFESLQKRADTTYRAQQQLTKDQKTLDDARKQGIVNDQRYGELQGLIAQSYQRTVEGAGKAATATIAVGKEAGLARHELTNLSRQAQDVFVGLTSGQSFGTVLIQQGTQVADVFANSQGTLKGFFGQVTSGLSSVLTPARLATAGLLGIGAAATYLAFQWSDAQDKVNQSLIGIGARTGTTAADINRFAEANSSATGLSIASAREVATEFTKTGNITVSALKGVGDAIHGYSVLTGKDASTATKEFAGLLGGDLVDAAKKLDQTYGFLNASTLDSIRNLQVQGDRIKAIQMIIDGTAADNQKAADSVGVLTKAYNALSNVLSNIKAGPAPTDPAVEARRQLEQAKQDRDNAAASQAAGFAMIGRNDRGELVQLKSLEEFDRRVDEAQRKVDGFSADNILKQFNKISAEADGITRAILPQLDAMDKFDEAIRKLGEAKALSDSNMPGVSVPGRTDDALQVLQYQRDLTKESLDSTVRQAAVVNQLKAEWGGVSSQTAVALTNLRGLLGVAQAVTGAQKIAAQEVATFNNLLAQGVSEEEAARLAAEQRAIAEANATTAVMQQVQSLKDQVELIKARQNGTEATTAASIAYRNAINSGADASAAAALKMQILAKYAAEAAAQANAFANAMFGAQSVNFGASAFLPMGLGGLTPAQANAPEAANFSGSSTPYVMTQSGSFTGGQNPNSGAKALYGNGVGQTYSSLGVNQFASPSLQDIVNRYVGSGDLAGAIAAAQAYRSSSTDNSEQVSLVDTLTQIKNSQTSDKGTQLENFRQQLAWLQTLPETIARDQAISSLNSNIQSLVDAINNNTDATEKNTASLPGYLSSLYAQDNVKGFGFATGGIMTKYGPAQLRAFAGGGIVDSPTISLAGERYEPEAIIPLQHGAVPVQLRGAAAAPPAAPNVQMLFQPMIYVNDSGDVDLVHDAASQAANDAYAAMMKYVRR